MNLNFKIIIIAIIVMQCVNMQHARAQFSLGLTGGTASRWSVPKNKEAVGFGYTASLKYKFKNHWAAGVNYSLFRFGPEEKNVSNVDYKISYYAYTGLVEYHLNGKRLKPYLGIDVGLYNYYTITTIDLGSGKQEQKLDKSYLGFAPTVGANYSIAKNILLNGNLKFNTVIIQQGAPIGYAAFSIGVFYAFNQ